MCKTVSGKDREIYDYISSETKICIKIDWLKWEKAVRVWKEKKLVNWHGDKCHKKRTMSNNTLGVKEMFSIQYNQTLNAIKLALTIREKNNDELQNHD